MLPASLDHGINDLLRIVLPQKQNPKQLDIAVTKSCERERLTRESPEWILVTRISPTSGLGAFLRDRASCVPVESFNVQRSGSMCSWECGSNVTIFHETIVQRYAPIKNLCRQFPPNSPPPFPSLATPAHSRIYRTGW